MVILNKTIILSSKSCQRNFKDNLNVQEKTLQKYITFTVTIEKELENGNIVTCKIKFIDSLGFMSNSLSNLADNFPVALQNRKFKGCKSCLKYVKVEDKLLIFSCSH